MPEGMAIYLQLDEPTLREVARMTGGEYHHAGTAERLRSVYQDLGSRVQVQTRETELTPLLALLAAVLRGWRRRRCRCCGSGASPERRKGARTRVFAPLASTVGRPPSARAPAGWQVTYAQSASNDSTEPTWHPRPTS